MKLVASALHVAVCPWFGSRKGLRFSKHFELAVDLDERIIGKSLVDGAHFTWTCSRQVVPLVRHLKGVSVHHSSTLRFDTYLVVDRSADPLFTTKVALSSLNRNVTEEELDLFQFSACCVT